jgi:hypothetical protein
MTTVTEDTEVVEQIERLMHSEELRGSDVLRRLLRFLAEKSASGEGEDLKEYVVAIDGMGKPSSYDPRHDSAVRIQVGRLRQKLADYYRNEGRLDPIIIDIPKGHFKLCYTVRQAHETLNGAPVAQEPLQLIESAAPDLEEVNTARSPSYWSRMAWALMGALFVVAAYGIFSVWKTRAGSATEMAGFTPELRELWEPFLTSRRPLIVAIEDPLFVEFHTGSGLYVRDKSVNDWKDVQGSQAISALRESLKGTDFEPSRYYTAFGEVHAAFLIGKLLGKYAQNFTILKTSDLSWQQLADNDIIFVGVQNLFFESQLKVLPTELQLVPVTEGIRNVHPRAGEPELFADKYVTAPQEEGTTYALITHLAGPSGGNHIESFTSSRSAGYIAAVKAFTDPQLARVITENLKKESGGRVPPYFQVLLRVKFKAEVPTATDCLLTRTLP